MAAICWLVTRVEEDAMTMEVADQQAYKRLFYFNCFHLERAKSNLQVVATQDAPGTSLHHTPRPAFLRNMLPISFIAFP
jgi:hypothetical protein